MTMTDPALTHRLAYELKQLRTAYGRKVDVELLALIATHAPHALERALSEYRRRAERNAERGL